MSKPIGRHARAKRRGKKAVQQALADHSALQTERPYLSEEEIVERCKKAHERAKTAKPNLDEKRLRDWMRWKKYLALIGKERPND